MTRSGTTILLVDDEEVVRDELGGILEDLGYRVFRGGDGEEGLALFREHSPDMVITDVRMPRRDGLSVAMTIRKEAPHVPVAVITGHGNEAMAIDALRAGVTDFIKKPVRLDDLQAALRRMDAARTLASVRGQSGRIAAVVEESTTWTYVLRNDLNAIPTVVDHVLHRCCADATPRTTMELSLALRELLLNAMEHGNLGITYAEKSAALEEDTYDALLDQRARRCAERVVRVTARRRQDGLRLTVRDEGQGFDWQDLLDPLSPGLELADHGRGILLARMAVDDLTYNEAGNEVTVSKTL